MAESIHEGFSLSHAAILDGTTGAEEGDGDIYGVNEASLEPDTDSFDNEGDDTVLSRWNWLNYATVNVQGGYIPFRLIALLTGEDVTSSGASGEQEFEMLLWTQRSMNVSPKPMLIRVPSKDSDGRTRSLEFVLFKVQFDPITFDGPTYKDGLKVNYNGTALMSQNDEAGDPLDTVYNVPEGTRAIGRMTGKPS